MPQDNLECDIAIVGGGPGGYAAALYASRLGLRPIIVEKEKVGGTCLHRGCVPAKHFLETAAVSRTVKKAESIGVSVGRGSNGIPRIDWPAVVARKSSVVERLWKGLSGLLSSAGVLTVEAEAKLDDTGSVLAVHADGASRVISAKKGTILAPGSSPKLLDQIPYDRRLVVTSDEVFDLPELPRSTVVVGAGSVGVEISSYFAEFGSQVTLVEVLPNVLPSADVEVSTALRRALESSGVRVLCEARVSGLEVKEEGSRISGTIQVETGEGEETDIEVDLVVLAVGRKPVSEGIGLDSVGVSLEPTGHIEVDHKTLQTSVEGIYAVGDVVSTPALAHVAFAEGMVAVRAIAGEDPQPIDYSRIPWCVYTSPEVAFCGLAESEAINTYGEGSVRVSKVNFAGNSRASIMGERRGFLKLVALIDGPVVGVHVIGPWASELLSPAYLATNWEAFPEEIATYIQPHPTLSEILGEAAMALTGRPLHG